MTDDRIAKMLRELLDMSPAQLERALQRQRTHWAEARGRCMSARQRAANRGLRVVGDEAPGLTDFDLEMAAVRLNARAHMRARHRR